MRAGQRQLADALPAAVSDCSCDLRLLGKLFFAELTWTPNPAVLKQALDGLDHATIFNIDVASEMHQETRIAWNYPPVVKLVLNVRNPLLRDVPSTFL